MLNHYQGTTGQSVMAADMPGTRRLPLDRCQQGPVKLRPGPLDVLQSALHLPLSNSIVHIDIVANRIESLL